MRQNKLEELYGYIDELKIRKRKLLEKKGHFLGIERYQCELNNGRVFSREKVIKNGMDGNACIILPITEAGDTLLVVQPRVFTENQVCVELPAGYVDDGETYEAAARRELLEETGYMAQSMQPLAKFYQDQGCMGAFNQSFLATNCRKVGAQTLDGDEFIKYFECSYDEALELVDMGLIVDAASQLTLERSKQYIKK